MGPRISDEKLNSIVDQLKQGVKPLVIAQNVECHLATVYRIDRNLKFFDSPRAPPAIRGRPKKITTDILEDIQEYCAGREHNPPGLAELAEFVTAKYGFSISQSSMSRAMKELGLLPKESQRLVEMRRRPKSTNSNYRVQKPYARPAPQTQTQMGYQEPHQQHPAFQQPFQEPFPPTAGNG